MSNACVVRRANTYKYARIVLLSVCVRCVYTKLKTNEYEESALIQTNENNFFLQKEQKKNSVLNYTAYTIVDSIFVFGSKIVVSV